jgi:hypothetical protein
VTDGEGEKKMYQPKTGEKCHCKKGIQRDNCPDCEGTGWRIDFKAIRAKTMEKHVKEHVVTDDERSNGPKRY